MGDVRVSGYPKVQATFARVIGYVEQSDIHSAHVSRCRHCEMILPSICYVQGVTSVSGTCHKLWPSYLMHVACR